MLVLPVQAGESLERVRAAVTEAKALAKKDIDLAVLFKLSFVFLRILAKSISARIFWSGLKRFVSSFQESVFWTCDMHNEGVKRALWEPCICRDTIIASFIFSPRWLEVNQSFVWYSWKNILAHQPCKSKFFFNFQSVTLWWPTWFAPCLSQGASPCCKGSLATGWWSWRGGSSESSTARGGPWRKGRDSQLRCRKLNG